MPGRSAAGWRCIFCSSTSTVWRAKQAARPSRLAIIATRRQGSTHALGRKPPTPGGSRTDPAYTNVATDLSRRSRARKAQPDARISVDEGLGPRVRKLAPMSLLPLPGEVLFKRTRRQEWERRALEDSPRETMQHMVKTKLREMLLKVDTPGFQVVTGLKPDTAAEVFRDFEQGLLSRMDTWSKDPSGDPVFQRLWDARMISESKMNELVKFWLQHHVVSRNVADRPQVTQRMSQLCAMQEPFEWFTEARSIQRKIHLHIGPTNSGKTYHALQQLERAETGVYAGPLRLLAHEVYQRMNAAGRSCALLTGDERLDPLVKSPGELPLFSCTVEMTPLDLVFDVAVIDEIQMIADNQRGYAWTKALLGLSAREIHLCGEERTQWLVEKIVRGLGDQLVVHRYQRLSPLEVQSKSLDGRFEDLKKGDCVVVFSVKLVHALRSHIENKTKRKVAIVYGSLPPEVRVQQAALFNDPNSGYDILVASDAIGMGLNLNIKRIIFYTLSKNIDGNRLQMEDSQIKQIAGRAGRFKVAPIVAKEMASVHPEDTEPVNETNTSSDPSPGRVTVLMRSDLNELKKAVSGGVPNLTKAYLELREGVFFQFASLFPPDTPFSYILLRSISSPQMHPLFQSGIQKDAVIVSDILQSVPGLSIKDRLAFIRAPTDVKNEAMIPILLELARHIGESRPIPILELRNFKLELLDYTGSATLDYLQKLETLHKAIILYNWLSYRYEALFTTRATAIHIRSLVEKRIEQTLLELGTEFQRKLRATLRRRQRKLDDEVAQDQDEGDGPVLSPTDQDVLERRPLDDDRTNTAVSEVLPLFEPRPTGASAVSNNP